MGVVCREEEEKKKKKKKKEERRKKKKKRKRKRKRKRKKEEGRRKKEEGRRKEEGEEEGGRRRKKEKKKEGEGEGEEEEGKTEEYWKYDIFTTHEHSTLPGSKIQGENSRKPITSGTSLVMWESVNLGGYGDEEGFGKSEEEPGIKIEALTQKRHCLLPSVRVWSQAVVKTADLTTYYRY
ncbi:hypothetical protein A6R68_21932, partial [Neotoma lepida]